MKLSTIQKFAPVANATRSLRTVLRWQLSVAVALALAASAWAGLHGALSALLGGLINVTAGAVYALMISGRPATSAGEVLRTLVRAEAGKIALIVLQLWLVLTTYGEVVAPILIGAFVISVLVFPMVLWVRD